MNHGYEHLLRPLTVGPLRLRNRIVASPTSIALLGDKGRITPEVIAYYEQKAAGGCAVVTVGDSIVRIRDGRSHPRQIPLDDPDEISGLTRLASAIHAHGAYASIQLNHGGGLCPPFFVGGETIGPSDLIWESAGTNGHPTPFQTKVRGMSEEELQALAEDFGRAAALARRCGFDLCMIHGGHGWLLHQFISELTNRRTDRYGGSLENRMRFPLLVIERVRAHAGPDFPIEFRMSGSERCPGGYDIDTGIEIAKMLDGVVDLIHVSAGTEAFPYSAMLTSPSVFQKHGEHVRYAAEIRRHVSTPVVAVGALSDPDRMEELLESGQADLLALGRELLADPFLPKKLADGRGDDVVRCLRCHECFHAMMTRDDLCCTVNPSIGRELRCAAIQPARVCKKVLVAGGGPAGMTAAILAARRGHRVTLCEKTGSLGGALHFADHIDIKENILRFMAQLEREMRALPISLRLNTPVTEETVRAEQPDVLFAAAGAVPIIPPIPGCGEDFVVLGAKLDPTAVRDRDVVVIGGGLVGCELAVELQRNGNRCTVVEMAEELAADAPIFHRIALMEEMKQLAGIHTGLRVTAIERGRVRARDRSGGERSFPADLAVLACGMRASEELEPLRSLVPRFIPIGDCYRPGKIGTAVRQAFDLVLDMEL